MLHITAATQIRLDTEGRRYYRRKRAADHWPGRDTVGQSSQDSGHRCRSVLFGRAARPQTQGHDNMTIAAEFDAYADCLSMHRALGQVELAAGRPELAVRHFKIAISATGDAAAGLFVVPDLVEAAVRAGSPGRARR